MHRLTHTLQRQSGVISRPQAVAAGLGDHDLRRLVRRRDLTPLLRGVYVNHTGEPSWQQRAWAAVLYAEPAALSGTSALRAVGLRAGGSGTDDPVAIVVDHARRVMAQPGVRIRRTSNLEGRVQWNASPPRVRLEPAVIEVASEARRDLDAVALLIDTFQERHTTQARLAAALAQYTRIPRRRMMTDVIAGLGDGSGSVLEHGYLTKVERPHRLPRGERQALLAHLPERRDVRYAVAKVLVELDGRDFHSLTRDRYADLERDAAAAALGHLSFRLGWGQVYGTPCRTASLLGGVLVQQGWDGRPQRCPRC